MKNTQVLFITAKYCTEAYTSQMTAVHTSQCGKHVSLRVLCLILMHA